MIEQGVRISFLNNATEGDRVIYSGFINSIPIVFANGLSVVDFEFTNNDSEIIADPLHRVKIGSDNEHSAINLRNFLQLNGYTTTSFPILYNVRFSGTIWNTEAIFSANETIYFELDLVSTNLSIVSFYSNPVPTTAPKYFFEYINIANNLYRCEIFEKGFTGTTTEIVGRATINKGEAKNHFDPIRGTGLTLSLEANENLKFTDFYSKNETDFTVRLYLDNALIFQGFLLPDGIFESFNSTIWNITVSCNDGLGALENLSFVKENGSQFSGKISILDAIYYCLNRTGIQLKINTYVPLYYVGLIDEDIETDVLKEAYVNTERFIKSDDNTIMSCKEVLTSLLEDLNAVVTQEDGEWFIYRPSEFYTDTYPFFKRYEIDNTYIGLRQVNLNRVLGSQVNNIYPHHCGVNQQINIKGAVSAFRLNYKYGFVSSLLPNGNLNHKAGTKIYEGWTVQNWTESKNSGYLSIDPVSTIGISFITAVFNIGESYNKHLAIISEESEKLLEGYTFDFKTRFISYGFPANCEFVVNLHPEDGSADWRMIQDGTWVLSNSSFILRNYDAPPNNTGDLVDEKFERSFTISTAPLPKYGKIVISMYVPFKNFGSPAVLIDVKSIELINTFQGNNVIGEFHTVERLNSPSSIIKDNKTVFNGDNTNNIYTGAIYMNDQETLTSLWHRRLFPQEGSQEFKPLLRISAEDELRIAQKPMKLFSGDFYGYIGYLIVMSINGLEGKFMPIAYIFDTFSNMGTMKSLELYAPELYDIDYSKTQDFGTTVSPTITS